MYPTLKEVLTNAPKSSRLTIAKHSWEKVTSDPWVLQTIQDYSLELLKTLTQLQLPEKQKTLMMMETES